MPTNLAERDLARFEQANNVRSGHVQHVGRLLGGELSILRDDLGPLAVSQQIEDLSQHHDGGTRNHQGVAPDFAKGFDEVLFWGKPLGARSWWPQLAASSTTTRRPQRI